MTDIEANKALVRRWIEEILTQGYLERADDLFARDYVLHDPSSLGTCMVRRA